MPKMFVSKSIDINAPKDKIKSVLTDFSQWRPWSPWMVLEPEATMSIAPDGKSYSWEGNRVGSGEMKRLSEEGDRINFDLMFLKPWKSHATPYFLLDEKNGTTTVTWNMDSSMPFFMFFMTKMMETMIGMDFERGLKMLKDYMEKGEVRAELEFIDKEDFKGTKYIGIRKTVSMDKMGEEMQKDIDAIGQQLMDSGLLNDLVFTQYHKFKMVKGIAEYTTAFGVTDYPDNLPDGWIKGELPAKKLRTVRLKGSYDHLGNAWSAVQNIMRSKGVKPDRSFHPVEFYRNSPAEVSEEELITDVSFALK